MLWVVGPTPYEFVCVMGGGLSKSIVTNLSCGWLVSNTYDIVGVKTIGISSRYGWLVPNPNGLIGVVVGRPQRHMHY